MRGYFSISTEEEGENEKTVTEKWSDIEHLGIFCDACLKKTADNKEDPISIKGPYFRCMICIGSDGFDLCSACNKIEENHEQTNHSNANHSKEHKESMNQVVHILQLHDSVMCDNCSITPIPGVRYTCTHKDCQKEGVDLCDKCILLTFENEYHKQNHLSKMKAIEIPEVIHGSEDEDASEVSGSEDLGSEDSFSEEWVEEIENEKDGINNGKETKKRKNSEISNTCENESEEPLQKKIQVETDT